MSKILCIYHGNCADGFAAACVLRHYFSAGVEFHAGVYGQPPPDTTGKQVYILDFSYPRDVLIAMATSADEVTVLDHHKTAKEQLEGLESIVPNLEVEFDMDRSGARITWDHFFPNQDPPRLIKHIEDRDLWRFALPGTREIQAGLFSYPYDFDIWTRFIFGNFVDELASDGKAIERKHHKDVAELVGVCARLMTIGGVEIPVASLPYTLVSDAAHEMALGQPFAACYWDTPMHRIFGLRSTDDGADVSAIAKQYGGGGHAHAAGFRVPRDHELAQA